MVYCASHHRRHLPRAHLQYTDVQDRPTEFLDLPSLGFFAKVVLPVGGGGVTAGSVDSRARGFLLNEVVLIMTFPNIQAPRATVQTQTSPAPADLSTFAQALVVAPVVKTSSNKTIRWPSRDLPRRIAKARRTLAMRSGRLRRVCV